jgi:hypothetical protein
VTKSKKNKGHGVQAIHIIEMSLAVLGGGVAGAIGYRFHAQQQVRLLQQRLLRAEEARNGAIERSAHAREQIAQLSKSISELRRAHQPARPSVARTEVTTAEERRAAAEQALARAAQGNQRNNEHAEPMAFAATQPMSF